MIYRLIFLWQIFIMLWLSGCGAYDLSSASLEEVSVDSGNPTWTNGVKAILEKKCDSCHGRDPERFTPANALKYVYQFSLDENIFNLYLSGLASARVFESPDDPMPPKYATPLTENEKTALKKFILQNK